MKLFLATVTALAVFTADGRDFNNEPQDQVPATEVQLFPDTNKGQLLEQLVHDGPEQDQLLEDNPWERRRGKTLCRKRLGGQCVRRRKRCPGHLPSQTSPGRPYCSKFHRCCHRVITTTTTAVPTTTPQQEYKAHQPGYYWSPSQCPHVSGTSVTTATLEVCMMLCTEDDECTALHHVGSIDHCELVKCPIPAPEPGAYFGGSLVSYSINQG